MNTYTIESATPETLADLYALQADSVERSRLLDTYRGRVERGETELRHTLLLRTSRGIEGSVMFGPAPHPYVFPHLRADAPEPAIREFLQELRRYLAVTPERQIVLDTSRADILLEPVVQAGWVLDDTCVYYETDLASGQFALAPEASEGGAELLEREDLKMLLSDLEQAAPDLTGGFQQGWKVVVLAASTDDPTPVAVGTFGPSRPGYGGVNMIGVRPAWRARGIGTALFRHLLARLAEHFDRHGGRTDASNYAMRRIFEKNGSVQMGTQRYYRQP